ncbi:AAA family ATPase [Solimicrobium silvestre]|uniref:AAA domain (Cdc48 subfamily) n=1 Tax=Solimicrobium silvestre TaxID=2099400 RepID=A0A2S9GYV0_9BURK|nr:AAA family ATPase [Solimicrobium silvestre]PRC92899.1 AAA domain (Cdc48 subfamily) [Solimicrobium silvestre]
MTLPLPRWQLDLERLLPIRSQFVISGSIHDSFLAATDSGATLVPFIRALWESLKARDYQFLLIYDPTDGVRVYPDELAARESAEKLFDVKLKTGNQIVSLETLTNIMKNLVSQREARCALVIDFASRLSREAAHLSEAEYRFFIAAEKLALTSSPIVTLNAANRVGEHQRPLYNPVLWLVNRAQDLPTWYTLDNERIASLAIGKPDYETRHASAQQLAPLFAGYSVASTAAQTQFLNRFAEGSEGMSLTALSDITELADRQLLGISDIDDAVRCYQLGALDNPWRKDYLREKIRDALPFIEERVKGQHPAVVKTLDILKRSVMGLTGAQAKSSGSRPRGVLFFAGPTGVGKTELAKTLTQLVFGDERAYLRFDMSEFAEQHSGARLLGAPPGYVGFDAGGELTNAVREKPFSVVLFDEIEKAHPQILDKFLQILEDGRLTDGRGETAYFSETILVFTSNLGVFVEDRQGVRQQQVKADDPYELVETKIRSSIEDYFKFKLARPELLNRIGDNIVVFNFITPDVAERIFDGMLKNIARRLYEQFKLQLSMPSTVRSALLERCVRDLSNGGRGIGNALEAAFINPLSRALFEHDLDGRQRLVVSQLSEQDKVIELTLEIS